MQLGSGIDTRSADFAANQANMQALVLGLREQLALKALGGPKASREKHRAAGKLLARERINVLLDPGSPFLELSALAAHGLYGDEVAGAGIITGIGRIEGRDCMVVCNDATVKGGTYYPLSVKKHLRAQEIAAENRLPWTKPADYDPRRYELLLRYIQAGHFDVLGSNLLVFGRKTDTNNNGPISTDHIGANWDYPEAPHAVRRKIWDDHVDYTKGLFYFLATDKRVPKKLQDEVNSWGHSKGEFEDTDNWPHQLYVREARRMLGAYVMTQADIMDKRTKDDSVGLGSYNTDSHHVQRVVGPDDAVLNEGDFQVGVKPYAIPYRSLTPKEEECKNLLVPLCMSASHVAYGTVRMEPVYMILGQASGVAASQAVDAKTAVQKIDVDKLRTKLKEQKAVLSPDEIPISKKATGIDPKKLGGIVVDDTQATRTGAWTHSTSTPGFVGEGYLHDNNKGQGKKKVRFTPKIQVKGMYEVRILYPAFANRASNALVVIHHAGGGGMIRVNQKTMPKGGFSLGVMPFDVGEEGWVEIRNDGADGFVVADAVQWIATTK